MSILDQKPTSPLKEGFGTKFGIGLVVAMSLSLAAFQLKVPYAEPQPYAYEPFEDGVAVIVVDEPLTHSRDKAVEPPKADKPKTIQIVIGEPDPAPGRTVAAITEIDPNSAIPTEVINEAPAPEPLKPIRVAEVMPQFPGGEKALLQYLSETPYCTDASSNGFEGTVYVEFIIDVDGTVKDVKLRNKLFPCVDKAVIAQVSRMPKWEPGRQGNRAVPVIITAPLKFTSGY